MKFNTTLSAVAAAALLGLGIGASAQTAVTTTTSAGSATESVGTISDFGNNVITIRTEGASAPVTYRYTKTTTYVDETGAPVSIETVKSGLPVTVHYVKEGDGMIADRVIVHRRKIEHGPAVIEHGPAVEHRSGVVEEHRSTTGPAVVEEHKSTTTTTETK